MRQDFSIGVIITLYNKENYIIRALLSMLNQSRQPDIVIIINDCSTDSSVNKVNQFLVNNNIQTDIKLVCLEKNVGAAEARNVALKQIDTDYAIFLDADDQYDTNYIDNIYKILKQESNIGMIMSCVKMESSSLIYPSSKIIKYIHHHHHNNNNNNKYSIIQKPFEILSKESIFIGGGNVCFNRQLITDFFDPREKNFEEWNFYYSILKESIKLDFKLIFNHTPSYIYNDIDEQSLSRKKIESYKNIVVPNLIKRLINKEEKKYKSLLISMWLCNGIDRLDNYKEKIRFIHYNIDIIKQAKINRYTIGAFARLIIPSCLYSSIKNIYKRKRFKA